MEPILLYGFPAGTSMGLVAALEWLGQPYQLARVDMLGEMREPGYARLNARHETPVMITDDGRVLTETMAIAAHLESRDSERRISFDPRSPEADRMHQLMAFLNSSFTSAFGPLWAALESTSTSASDLDALRTFGRGSVIKRHDQLEAMVGDDPYLTGDHPTLADALLAGVARWLEVHEVAPIARWPKLAALRTRVEATPAVRFALARENGDTPPSAHLTAQLALSEVIERAGA
ncbi:MAG: glutathione S-transferase family protein [Kofleriaceae bacterium]